jgi:PadR family transcriptional regulator, regulatory protein AphA
MSIKHAVLGLLHYKDMHGYQIKDHIEKNFGYMWTINYGQIYTSLKALVDEGCISLIDVVPSNNGAPHKKLYSLTDKGRKEFKKWLKNPPEKQMLLRDPFLMRFIFFGFGDNEDALKLIEEQIQLYEQQLSRREAKMPRWKNQGMYVRLTAELGLSFNEMFLQWLYTVRDEIRDSTAHDMQVGSKGLF